MTKNVKSDTFCESIKTYIDAAYPLLLIESFEEDRACEKVRKLASTIPTHPQVFEWSVTSGFSKVENGKRSIIQPAPMLNMALDIIEQRAITGNRPAIYILKDIHNLITVGGNPEPSGVRKLRDLYGSVMQSPDTVILLSPEMEIPHDLQKQITVVDLPLPTEPELEAILRGAMTDASSRPDHAYDSVVVPIMNDEQLVHKLAQAGRGMTGIEFDNAVAKGFSMKSLTPQTMIQEKAQVIRKSGALKYIHPSVTPEMVGGLDVYKEWMLTCVERFKPEAREYGLQPPKGALLVGPPGTGKSMCCEMSAYMLNIVMLELESANTHSKWVGQSARNMKRSLDIGHSLTPCVFTIDEGEKMMGGTHEATVQMKGVWLTDYENHDDGMFTLMTCNDHKSLSPEVLQRFERVWYMGPPTLEDRKSIFATKIRGIPSTIGYDPSDFDLGALAEATPGFVGREIRTIIKESLVTAFSKKERLETTHILDYLESANITPTTVQRATEIAEMVAWAEQNATNANRTAKGTTQEIGAMTKGSRYKR